MNKLAPSYISAIVLILSQILPLIGINLVAEDLNTTIQSLIALATGLIVAYRQFTTGKSTLFGMRPNAWHFLGIEKDIDNRFMRFTLFGSIVINYLILQLRNPLSLDRGFCFVILKTYRSGDYPLKMSASFLRTLRWWRGIRGQTIPLLELTSGSQSERCESCK